MSSRPELPVRPRRIEPPPAIRLLVRCATLALPWCFALASARAVTIQVDASLEHQTWYGFGATHQAEVFGTTDVLTASQRTRMLDLLYNEVRIRAGQVPNLFEAPQNAGPDFFNQQANDNGDPFTINGPGFTTWLMDTYRTKVVDLVPPGVTADLYPSQNINTRWSSQWLEAIRPADYQRFLNECAEQVLAGITQFAAVYGREPAFDMLFNEPTTGNRELQNGNDAVIRDLVRRCGDRLRAAGFNEVRFVVPAQETEETSLSTATFLCADPTARQYVGAISYHPYPYGSQYSYIPNILAHSGNGTPPADRIAVRNQLRDLGRQYGIPLWMTEVSNGFYGNNNPSNMEAYDALRGRAIHIHDEIRYAEAAAFFGMQSDWSQRANELHGLGSAYGSNPDDVIFTDQDEDRTFISGMGRAIGHYARFISRGATVLESASDDPLVLVTAFRDAGGGEFQIVLINNATEDRFVQVALAGIGLTGDLAGEQSTAAAYWQPIGPIGLVSASTFALILPARSVTSLAAPAGAPGSADPSETGGIAPDSGQLSIRPSPARDQCRVSWRPTALDGTAGGSLLIYDVTGRALRTLEIRGGPSDVDRETRWDLRDATGATVTSGLYFIHLQSPGRQEARAILVVR